MEINPSDNQTELILNYIKIKYANRYSSDLLNDEYTFNKSLYSVTGWIKAGW